LFTGEAASRGSSVESITSSQGASVYAGTNALPGQQV
jgi:hypothetical protein